MVISATGALGGDLAAAILSSCDGCHSRGFLPTSHKGTAAVQSSVRRGEKRTAALLVAAAFAIFALVDVLAFRTGLYRAVLDPSSSTGSFEAAIAQFRALPGDPRTDVLVLGDSRIYSGLDPSAASAARRYVALSQRRRPRHDAALLAVFRARDRPEARRFRAVVIAVDTYADDDTAIGSLDGDDRPMDLRYVVFQTRLRDLPQARGLVLRSARAHRVRHRSLLARAGAARRLPGARGRSARALSRPRARCASPAYDPLAAHPRSESLAGLRVDFAKNTITYPAGISDDERQAIATQVLTVAKPSPSYAIYRSQWLAPIAARYAPPASRSFSCEFRRARRIAQASQIPSGSLANIARDQHARLLPAAPYIALEQPELFADEDHLNRAGSLRFSRLLGHERRTSSRQRCHPERVGCHPELVEGRHPCHPEPVEGRAGRSRHPASLALVVRRGLRHRHPAALSVVRVLALLSRSSPRCFIGLPRRDGRFVLLIASYYFYARWNAWYVLFLWILTASDFLIALALEDRAIASTATAAPARARRRRKSRLSRQLQVHELRERHGRRAGRHARESLARQSLRADRHQLPHVPKHLVSRRRLSRPHDGDPQAARLRALSGLLSAAARRARSCAPGSSSANSLRGGRRARTTSATAWRAPASAW